MESFCGAVLSFCAAILFAPPSYCCAAVFLRCGAVSLLSFLRRRLIALPPFCVFLRRAVFLRCSDVLLRCRLFAALSFCSVCFLRCSAVFLRCRLCALLSFCGAVSLLSFLRRRLIALPSFCGAVFYV
jgi:hypothetical protein